MIPGIIITVLGVATVHEGDPGGWWFLALGALICTLCIYNAFTR